MKTMRTFLLVILPILACLWGNAQNAQERTVDSILVTQAAMDYMEGFYSGDAVRMEKALHPDLNKVCPATMNPTGKIYLMYSTYSGLIELTRAKAGALPENKRKMQVMLLVLNENVACVRVKSASFNDYLQLVKLDQDWKIVNVLWTWGEDSPNRKELADYKGFAEKAAVETVVRSLIEGIYSSDVTRVEKALHPEYRRATLMQLPTTGEFMIQRDAAGSLVEATRAGLGAADRDKWNIQVRMIDSMDGLALAEIKVPSGWSYCQLAKIDGEWKIINILRKIAKQG